MNSFQGTDISSAGFSITNNVYITVVNKKKQQLVKQVEKHNKATRRMVTGLLKFIEGKFDHTNGSRDSIADDDNYWFDKASDYIPLYIGIGKGFIDKDQPYKEENPLIPNIVSGASNYVHYNSTHLEDEFPVMRSKIRAVKSSVDASQVSNSSISIPNMDSIYFNCEIPANTIKNNLKSEFVTEVGLFSGNQYYTEENPTDDMLAYVKLLNYEKVLDYGEHRSISNVHGTILANTKSCYLYYTEESITLEAKNIVKQQTFDLVTRDATYHVVDGIVFNSDKSQVCGTFDYENGYVCFNNVFTVDVSISVTTEISVYDTEEATNALYVKPDDTIIIKWVISIASIGIDNMFATEMRDESNRPLTNTLIVPDVPVVNINVINNN